MKASKTKRALLMSILSMFLCFVMFLGTTFAWLTDSVSSGVNRILAGNLDVQLLDVNGQDLEGRTLNWIDENGQVVTSVGWVPGNTYNLTPFKIKNNGNLALKYRIDITGIGGNKELNQVINWTYKEDNNGTSVAMSTEGRLSANAETGLITIQGTMDDNAGTAHSNQSIDHIAITVIATQDTVEKDSFNDQYDADAVIFVPAGDAIATGTISNVNAVFTLPDSTLGLTVTIPANTLKAEDAGRTITSEMIRTGVTSDSVTYDISFKVNGTDRTEFSQPIMIERNIGANLKDITITHTHGETTDTFTKVDAITDDKQFTYDSVTGLLVISSKTFSEFRIGFTQKPANDVDSDELFAKLITEDKENIVINLVEDINFTLDNYYSTVLGGNGTKSVTINGNGHKLTFVSSYRNAINANGKLTINDAVIDST